MANKPDISNFLREMEFPTIWCSGCGHGIVVKAAIRAIAKQGWANDDVLAVSGIGCSARSPAYCDYNSIQTTHGRAIAFATGMKLHRPDMLTVLFLGDGDCTAIGGNHFMHAAKRNIDMTVIIMNNHIYGMTGGQVSPTTPFMGNSTTTPFGNLEPELDVCKIAEAAGATYVARTTAYHVNQMMNVIEKGLLNKGFSVIECLSPCPTGYGRKNKFPTAVSMYESLRDLAVPVEKAKQMSEKEMESRFAVGVLKQSSRPEFTSEYNNMLKRCKSMRKDTRNFLEIVTEPGEKTVKRSEIRLTGSGGQGLILAGIMMAEAGIRQGKNAVHTQSYGPEARGGASRSEVIIGDEEIYFPEVFSPDILLAMTQQASDKYAKTIKAGGLILVDSTFVSELPDVNAKVYQFPITEAVVNKLGKAVVANVVALGMLARFTDVIQIETLKKAILSNVPEAAKELNLEAVQAGYDWADKLLQGKGEPPAW